MDELSEEEHELEEMVRTLGYVTRPLSFIIAHSRIMSSIHGVSRLSSREDAAGGEARCG